MPDTKGNPCGKDAPVEVSVSSEGKRYVADLCSQHGQQLVNAGRPVTVAASSSTTTFLPKAGPSAPTVESATKAWALKKGGDIAASINQRGRQPKELKEKFLASPEGRVWKQETGQ